jgi:hypothetical protein
MTENLFTSSDLIETCVNRIFKKNCIRHLSLKDEWNPYPEESFIQIRGKQVSGIKIHETQSEHRFKFLQGILSLAIERYDLNLNCAIIFNLTDGINPAEYYTRMCFSAPVESNHILIPDPHLFHHIATVNQQLAGDSPFESKIDNLTFYGSDSGLVDEGLLNQRVRFCAKAVGRPNLEAKVTSFVHFSEEMLKNLGVNKKEIESPYRDIKYQLKSKYILDIDGNGSSWDRTPWAMSSNCYLTHLKSEKNTNVNWYHPFIEKNGILPTISEEDALNSKVLYDSKIKEKQKSFASILLKRETQLEYFSKCLVRYNEIFNS